MENNKFLNENLVKIENNYIYTTSLDVARVFHKRHADVLRAIENLDIDKEFRRLNFALSSYINSQNKKQPMYKIFQDGFTILVMGFTGKHAMKWKIDYINLFNKMRNRLLQSQIDDRNSQKWIATRSDGKLIRKELTDVIADLIEYARTQGSEKAGYYYKHITEACNKALYRVPSLTKIDKNLRDELNYKQLINLAALENNLAEKIEIMAKAGIYYKTIYQNCKVICDRFSDLIGQQKPDYITEPEYKKCMDIETAKIYDREQNQLSLI
jgi:Rha family phage regulatory protein